MRSLLLLLSAVLVGAAPRTAPAVPQVRQHIPLPDGGWDILTVDSENHRVLISRSDGVDAVDTRTGVVTPRFVAGTRFHGVTVVPRTQLAVATEAAGAAVVFNRLTGKVIAEVKTDRDADATLFEPRTRTIWVMNGDSGTISIVDPAGVKSVGKISLGSALEFAATDGRGHVFVNLSDKGELAEVDVAGRKVMGSIPLAGCQHSTGLAYVHPGLLISACANGVAKVTRGGDLKALADIAIGPRPDGAFADDARHRAYVTSGGDGTLTVIDTSGPLPRKIATVQTETGARTGAVDPSTGTVYSIAAKFGPPPAGGGRPPILPGTVELLVIR